ncbi:rna recognition motif-containing protein [Cystoisospora suis]|uniref:Rna recognition motif-containing protein n=1 Tax=Cystoisospora suis TaxID=483139 RepID=A0A2C6L157_9APIC|nr:rna recognition motif-containing protein [Cystoisospora suis]
MVNGIMARRVYVPPHHRKVTTSCSNSIFLANIPSDVTKLLLIAARQAELAQLFGYFGDIRSVVVHNEKRIAFLEFSTHASALAAITHMQGYVLRHHTLACSWSVRRHTTYQDEGIEEDDGYRRSEEAFAYNAAKAMEPTVGLANGAHAASELDPTLLAAGDRAVRLKNPAQGEAALELSPERHLFWLSFYAADPRVSSRTLLATMDAALESSKTSSPRPSP